MNVLIRPYTKNDKEGCLEAFKSNVPLYFTEGEVKDFEFFLDNFLIRSMTEKLYIKTYYYVVELNHKILGCGGFGDKEGTDTITLAWGLVHKDFHKQGYGEKLLSHRLEAIQNLYPGAPVVIDTTQHSFPFFEKFGFVTTKITENFYADDLHRYDMLWKPL